MAVDTLHRVIYGSTYIGVIYGCTYIGVIYALG